MILILSSGFLALTLTLTFSANSPPFVLTKETFFLKSKSEYLDFFLKCIKIIIKIIIIIGVNQFVFIIILFT